MGASAKDSGLRAILGVCALLAGAAGDALAYTHDCGEALAAAHPAMKAENRKNYSWKTYPGSSTDYLHKKAALAEEEAALRRRFESDRRRFERSREERDLKKRRAALDVDYQMDFARESVMRETGYDEVEQATSFFQDSFMVFRKNGRVVAYATSRRKGGSGLEKKFEQRVVFLDGLCLARASEQGIHVVGGLRGDERNELMIAETNPRICKLLPDLKDRMMGRGALLFGGVDPLPPSACTEAGGNSGRGEDYGKLPCTCRDGRAIDAFAVSCDGPRRPMKEPAYEKAVQEINAAGMRLRYISLGGVGRMTEDCNWLAADYGALGASKVSGVENASAPEGVPAAATAPSMNGPGGDPDRAKKAD